MQKPTSYADYIKEWEDLLAPLVENAAEMPQLEIPTGKLQGMLDYVRTLSQQQAVYTASKQDASKKLEAAIEQGRKLATFLRFGIKEHYGNSNEKLKEFRIQPFRSRLRKVSGTPPVEIAPSVPSTPADTASS